MHYGAYDFSNGNGPTIETIPANTPIGQRNGADAEDILQVQYLYQCASSPRNALQFANDPCSTDCKCWEGKTGCASNAECQAGLVCSSGTCTSTPTISPAPSMDRTPAPSLSPGSVEHVYAKYYDATGWTSLPSPTIWSLPSYKAEFVSTINYPTTPGEFAGSGRSDNVAAYFFGLLTFNEAGIYSLRNIADGPLRVYFNFNLVFDRNGPVDQQVDVTVSGTPAYAWYDMEYLETTGDAQLQLLWKPPSSSSYSVIPAESWSVFVSIFSYFCTGLLRKEMTLDPFTNTNIIPFFIFSIQTGYTASPTGPANKVTAIPSSLPSFKPSSQPSFRPSLIPSPSVTPVCSDDTTWKFDGNNRKTCGWVAIKPRRRCKLSAGDVSASEACPVACGKRREKICSIPECNNEEGFWESKTGSTCDDYLKVSGQEKRTRCIAKGVKVPTGEKMFTYEACSQCTKCISPSN